MPDITITAIQFPQQTGVVSIQLGEACDAFDVVYFGTDAQNQPRYFKADATDVVKANAKYILQSAGTVDAWVTAIPLKNNLILVGSNLTPAGQYVVSANPGKIAPRADLVQGNLLTNLFIAAATENARFNLDPTEIAIP